MLTANERLTDCKARHQLKARGRAPPGTRRAREATNNTIKQLTVVRERRGGSRGLFGHDSPGAAAL